MVRSASFGELGPLLREARARRGLTQEQVAKAADCSTAYVGLLEQGKRGQRPSRDLSLRLARAVAMSPDVVDGFLRAAGHLRAHESIFDPQDRDVITEIARDVALSDSHKGLLISVYAALSRLEPDHNEGEHLGQVHETPDPVATDKDSSNKTSAQPLPERSPPPDDLLRVEEVCGVLGLSRAALYALRYRGEAPAAIKVGRQLRWQRSELDRWIAERPVERAMR